MASAQLPPSDDSPTPPGSESRPLSVTAAAGILLAVGVVAGLVGLVLLIVVVVNSNPAALPGYVDVPPAGFAAAAATVALLLVGYGLAATATAVQALRRRRWARGLGILLAGIGTAALVLAMIRPGQASGAAPLIFAPIVAALAYAAVALASEAGWFNGSVSGETGTG